MQSVLNTIKNDNLIKSGDIIGIAVSGGSDSMALLHYLHSIKDELDIGIVALHVDHSIRETSGNDADFVSAYCKEKGIRLFKTRIDVPSHAKQKSIGLEQSARECRYDFFASALEKGIVDKIALAHHADDQAETILMHILRGSGLSGAIGMTSKRDNYIRPMLNTTKQEILAYLNQNNISYVTDETNFDIDYNRNFIRNKVFPLLKQRYPFLATSLINFGKSCKEDSDYINSQIPLVGLIKEKHSIKIPLSYFINQPSIINRIIFTALKQINIVSDIERKHVEMIKELANDLENGSRIDLPNQLVASKEYEYITLTAKYTKMDKSEKVFKAGKFNFEEFGLITVKKTSDLDHTHASHLLDANKIPKGTVWRYRKDGDTFTKFGSGKKKLKSYFIDKKIPARLRDSIPLLASGDEILLVLGYEISERVKIDDATKNAYAISILKN